MRIGEKRTRELQRRMKDEGLDAFVLNDADSIFYFGEYWDYLGMDFGRATVMGVPRDDGTLTDGCCVAEDAGLRIKGGRIDVVAGRPDTRVLWDAAVPSNRGVRVVVGDARCVARRAAH